MVLFCSLLTNFCVGLSIGPLTIGQPSLFLQIKNASSAPIFERMDWTVTANTTLTSTFNPNISVGVISDNDLLVRAGDVRILKFPNLSTEVNTETRIQFKTSNDRCITVMQCKRGDEGYCDPQSNEPVEQVSHIQLGTYLKLFPCGTANDSLAIAQHFYQINHNCTMEKLTNGKCDRVDCNYPVFRNDSFMCNGTDVDDDWHAINMTEAPVASPSTMTPTLSPSSSSGTLHTNPPTLMETTYSPSPSPTPYLRTEQPSVVLVPDSSHDGNESIVSDYETPVWIAPVAIIAGVLFLPSAWMFDVVTKQRFRC